MRTLKAYLERTAPLRKAAAHAAATATRGDVASTLSSAADASVPPHNRVFVVSTCPSPSVSPFSSSPSPAAAPSPSLSPAAAPLRALASSELVEAVLALLADAGVPEARRRLFVEDPARVHDWDNVKIAQLGNCMAAQYNKPEAIEFFIFQKRISGSSLVSASVTAAAAAAAAKTKTATGAAAAVTLAVADDALTARPAADTGSVIGAEVGHLLCLALASPRA